MSVLLRLMIMVATVCCLAAEARLIGGWAIGWCVLWAICMATGPYFGVLLLRGIFCLVDAVAQIGG